MLLAPFCLHLLEPSILPLFFFVLGRLFLDFLSGAHQLHLFELLVVHQLASLQPIHGFHHHEVQHVAVQKIAVSLSSRQSLVGKIPVYNKFLIFIKTKCNRCNYLKHVNFVLCI